MPSRVKEVGSLLSMSLLDSGPLLCFNASQVHFVPGGTLVDKPRRWEDDGWRRRLPSNRKRMN